MGWRRSRAARITLALAGVAVFAVLVRLGFWQLERLAWKEALIAAAAERPVAAAVPAPGPAAWPDFALGDWNYRRVRLTGRFGAGEAHAFVTLSEPRGELGGFGYFVVAPFTTEEGWSVLVNRGFVPEAAKDPADRPGSAPPDGVVTVEGLVRRDDPPNFVTPEPDLEANRWYARTIAPIAAFLGLPAERTAPYSVDLVAEETPPGGLPQAGESVMTFSNNHLGYAVTWFGLAAALVGVAGVAVLRRG